MTGAKFDDIRDGVIGVFFKALTISGSKEIVNEARLGLEKVVMVEFCKEISDVCLDYEQSEAQERAVTIKLAAYSA